MIENGARYVWIEVTLTWIYSITFKYVHLITINHL